MIGPQQPGWCWPLLMPKLDNMWHCDIARKLGVLRKNATLRIGHQMKRQNSFYVVDVKCLLELQLLLNCPEWGLQQGVILSIPRQQELVIRRRRLLAVCLSKIPDSSTSVIGKLLLLVAGECWEVAGCWWNALFPCDGCKVNCNAQLPAVQPPGQQHYTTAPQHNFSKYLL